MSRCACGRACRSPEGPCTYCKRLTDAWRQEANERRRLRKVRLLMFSALRTEAAANQRRKTLDRLLANALTKRQEAS